MPEAYAALATALLNYLTEVTKGQTAEQKKQIWDWYIEDVKWWRKFLHID